MWNSIRGVLGWARDFGLLAVATFGPALNPSVRAEPVPPIAEGYGANGTYSVAISQFPSPLWQTRNVTVYRPAEAAGPVPTIFFSHGFQGESPIYYDGLLRHLATRGYAVVFSPYRTVDSSDLSRYATLAAGFSAAATLYPQWLDTSRVGFVGHSFGGGASVTMAYQGLVEKGWGSQGAFLYSMAPWYSLFVSDEQIASLPSHLKTVAQVYEGDRTNDWRMGADIYRSMPGSATEKDFLTIRGDSFEDQTLHADHFIPLGSTGSALVDAMDWYGTWRIADALADYAFTGSLDGKAVALGNGGAEQVFMGEWPDGPPVTTMLSSDNPLISVPQDEFVFAWDTLSNQRTVDGDGNADRRVTTADYTVWANHFDESGIGLASIGDYNFDGTVTAADYTVWANELDLDDVLQPMAVPEPGSAVLLALGGSVLAALMAAKRHQRVSPLRPTAR